MVRALTSVMFNLVFYETFHFFQADYVASDITKPQVYINSNNLSIDCEKTATENKNLQPEIEINE